MILIIPGRLPSLNDIIKLSKQGRGRYQPYANMKSMYETVIVVECKKQKLIPINKKVEVSFTWYCKDRRRDKDNIIAGQKLVFDALRKAGIIKNDGWEEIGKISHDFRIDKKERIEVELTEVK